MADETPEDDNKRKFREALERKKAKTASRTEHRDGGAKQSKQHGPVENRREFRRKSG
ncbi:DUF5302 domain-containing protein [Mycobacterium sp. MS1601]|uniref:DUF5302 domain-containing protein n=1 Tax=Mycobacterium sp. MS1601 TaxID=1936029 RepID=UPI0012FB2E13|nr:DUF5302 domain-containing protein [Mycobacterium sp. MS1601]